MFPCQYTQNGERIEIPQNVEICNKSEENDENWEHLCNSILFPLLHCWLVCILRFWRRNSTKSVDKLSKKGYWYLEIVKCAYAFVILFSSPVVAYSALTTVDGLIFKGERVLWRRLLESFVWCSIVWFIAMMVPQLDVVFGLTGATGGILLIYVLPAYFYIAVAKRIEKRAGNSSISIIGPHWLRSFAYFLISFTLILGIISTISQLLNYGSSS